MNHNRRSIRKPQYDYRQAGFYFVTICTHRRQRFFLNEELYMIAAEQWQALPEFGARAALGQRINVDAWVVMPDHVHGIIVIHDDAGTRPSAITASPSRTDMPHVPAGSLGAIVRSYKASVTRRVNLVQQTPGELLWQRGYWERIVRSPEDLERIRRYIAANPYRAAKNDRALEMLLARMNRVR
jgi:REP element-mobilizing transposase RayT